MQPQPAENVGIDVAAPPDVAWQVLADVTPDSTVAIPHRRRSLAGRTRTGRTFRGGVNVPGVAAPPTGLPGDRVGASQPPPIRGDRRPDPGGRAMEDSTDEQRLPRVLLRKHRWSVMVNQTAQTARPTAVPPSDTAGTPLPQGAARSHGQRSQPVAAPPAIIPAPLRNSTCQGDPFATDPRKPAKPSAASASDTLKGTSEPPVAAVTATRASGRQRLTGSAGIDTRRASDQTSGRRRSPTPSIVNCQNARSHHSLCPQLAG